MSDGVLSFLSQGAPIAAPTSSDSSTAFPLWLQESLYNTIGAASNLASQPYSQFPGPTVAQPSDATQASWNMAQNNVGNWAPFLGQGANLMGNAAQGALNAQSTAQNSTGAWQPYVGNAATMTGGAAQGALNANAVANNNVGAWAPAVNNAGNTANLAQGYALQNSGNWAPALNQAGALNSMAAAVAAPAAGSALNNLGIGLPQIGQASNATNSALNQVVANNGSWNGNFGNAYNLTAQGGTGLTTQGIDSILNPYTGYVLGGLDYNLLNNIMPAVSDRFVSSGQVASPQMAQLAGQAIYGTQLAGGQALDTAYNNAISGSLASNQQKLTAGAQYGQLASNQAELANQNEALQLQGAAQQGQLGAEASGVANQNLSGALNAASGLNNIGTGAANLGALGSNLTGNTINQMLTPAQFGLQTGQVGAGLGAQDVSTLLGAASGQGQIGAQYGALGQLTSSLTGQDIAQMLAPVQAEQGLGTQFGALGTLASQLGAQDVSQVAGAGAGQDAANQANINAALNAFNQQQQWPYQNLSYLTDIIRGLPTGQVGSTTQTAGTTYQYPASAASPLSSGLSSLLTARALGLKKGGRVKAPRGALSMHKKAA